MPIDLFDDVVASTHQCIYNLIFNLKLNGFIYAGTKKHFLQKLIS